MLDFINFELASNAKDAIYTATSAVAEHLLAFGLASFVLSSLKPTARIFGVLKTNSATIQSLAIIGFTEVAIKSLGLMTDAHSHPLLYQQPYSWSIALIAGAAHGLSIILSKDEDK